ncbi:hypothetical protein MJ547_04275, partial [Burkholderia gladioli]
MFASIAKRLIGSWDHSDRRDKIYLISFIERADSFRTNFDVLRRHVVLETWLRTRGYGTWDSLLRFGTADDILWFTVYKSDAERRWTHSTIERWCEIHGTLSSAFEHLAKDDGVTPERVTVFTDIIMAMLDQGAPPRTVAQSCVPIKRLLAQSRLYQRLIDGMSTEDLNTVRNTYVPEQGPLWLWLMSASLLTQGSADVRHDIMLDQVVRLRAKGVDVSSQRLLFGDGQGWDDSDRIGPALIDVEGELRRREGAMLMDLADTVLVVAAGDETPQPGERKRL